LLTKYILLLFTVVAKSDVQININILTKFSFFIFYFSLIVKVKTFSPYFYILV